MQSQRGKLDEIELEDLLERILIVMMDYSEVAADVLQAALECQESLSRSIAILAQRDPKRNRDI